MRPLVRLLVQDPFGYAILVGLWITARLAIIGAGLLLQSVFNELTGHSPVGLTVMALVAAVLAAESAKVVIWYGVVLSRVEPVFTHRMRSRLRAGTLTALLRKPPERALKMPVGDALSRFGTDVDEAGVFAIWSASNVARLIVAITAVGIMISISPAVTLGVVLPLVLVIVVGRSMNGLIARYRTAAREAAAQVSTSVGEAVLAVQAIKVAGAEKRLVQRVRVVNDRRATTAVREQVLGTAQESLFQQAATIGTGLLLLLAAQQMTTGAFTVGDLALFVFYLGFLSEAVWALGMSFLRSKRAALSLTRLTDLAGDDSLVAPRIVYLDREPAPLPAIAACEPAEIAVQRLSYQHPGSAEGIFDASFTLPAGSLTVIVGRVGSGKTTLLRALLGVVPVSEGEITWEGRPVTNPAEFFTVPRCAYTPQVSRLFNETLRDNILLGIAPDPERLAQALSDAVLTPDLTALSDGLDTAVGSRGRKLSGGQAQRTAIARTLVRRPALMVLDDVSNALDVRTEDLLWERVLARSESTILAVGNRRALLRRADQILVMERGRIAAFGTFAEALAASAEMRMIWDDPSVTKTGDSALLPAVS